MESVHNDIEKVNRAEVVDLHAEDKGEEPYSPPVDVHRDDNLYGDYLYSTPFTDDEERAGAVSVTYEVSRAERKITDKRYDQLRPLFLFTDKRSLNIHC